MGKNYKGESYPPHFDVFLCDKCGQEFSYEHGTEEVFCHCGSSEFDWVRKEYAQTEDI